jgi:uncharacterized protein
MEADLASMILAGAVTTLVGACVAAGAATTPNVSLPADIQQAIRSQYGADARYLAAPFDLNGDLQPEQLVYVVDQDACRPGGCPTLVFTREEGRQRLISVISRTQPPIGVSTGGMAGWRNLVVRAGGNGKGSAPIELSSDGMIYPYDPTAPGPLVKPFPPGQEFKILIPDSGSSTDPVPLAPASTTTPGAAATVAAAAKPITSQPVTQHPVTAARPSFDCATATEAIERLVCADDELASLDRALGTAYADALAKWSDAAKPAQRRAQQAWTAERNACATQADARDCAESSYRRRLVTVQIEGGQLVDPTAVEYLCKERVGEPLSIAFYDQTKPASAVIAIGHRRSIAFRLPTAGGLHYRGADVDVREHQGEVTVRWRDTTLTCRVRRAPAAS